MRQWSCCVSLEKAYHLIWPGTYWLLLSISEELLLQASCAAQHHVCFHLGETYAAHGNVLKSGAGILMSQLCIASCGFEHL